MTALKNYYPHEDQAKIDELEKLWNYVRKQIPECEEGLSYGLPALKLDGRPLIGFGISKDHLSLYPFSPEIITTLLPELQAYELSKGVIRFSVDNPVTDSIIDLLLEQRLAQLRK